MVLISLLFSLGLPILLIAFLTFAVAKNKKEGEKEDMFKQLYVYLVLFFTLMMTIGGGIGIFMGASDYVSPTTYYERYEDYKFSRMAEAQDRKIDLNEEIIRQDYERMIDRETERTKQQGINTIIKSFGFIIIPFPIFLYFNRMRKQDSKHVV
ncbi:hypothetical protein [Bacillus sp. CGMCC 1.16541]|uniref:hypothetical protein n=1 Tax=Bacillus sp. CGMCC 1.16541 TaxID=2185143 RepID=UPI000D731404|nr:hypothetical protein [Bacillus sp. CGMCC 1.16541]